MNYNKKDILNYINNLTKINKKTIKIIINIFFKEISYLLINKKNIKINGFGKFIIKKKNSKKWKNPITKKKIHISSKKSIVFVASKKFKKFIKKKK